MQTKKQNEEDVELKIILTGNKIVSIGNPSKPIKVSQLAENEGTDLKLIPLCHSHAHGYHLFSD